MLMPSGVAYSAGSTSLCDTIPGGSIVCGIIDSLGLAVKWTGYALLLNVIAGTINTYAGIAFNFMLQYTVADFSKTLDTYGFVSHMQTAWTFFRDLANIGIIGIFTFIAISIILGLQQFGQKKLVARVIVIALLINFSFLFSKLMIDISGVVAQQFYTASIKTLGTSDGTSQLGIADIFLQRAGIPSTYGGGNGVLADLQRIGLSPKLLVYYIITTALYIGFGLIFLYGIVVLTARAVFLFAFTVLSPLAFATYLLPSLSDGPYGWKAWWEGMLRAALLGPLLIMLLWASLVILGTTSGGQTLGAFLTNPSGGAISALFGLVLTIGFLIFSLRLAGSFAKSVAGFSHVIGFAMGGLAYGTGVIGRKTLGFAGQRRADQLDAQIADEKSRLAFERSQGRNPSLRPLQRLTRDKTRAESAAKTVYNPLKTQLGKDAFSALGGSDLMKKNLGGGLSFSDYMKKQVDEAKKVATSTVVDEKTAKSYVEQGREDAHKALIGERDRSKEVQEKTSMAADQAVESRGFKQQQQRADEEVRKAEKQMQEKLSEISERLGSAMRAGDSASVSRIRSEQSATMHAEDQNIKQAKARAAEIAGEITRIRSKETHAVTLADGTTAHTSGEEAADRLKKAGDAISEAAKKLEATSKAGVSQIMADQTRGLAARTFGYDDYVAKKARKSVDVEKHLERLKKIKEAQEKREIDDVVKPPEKKDSH
jgi:hypothetical protein